MKCPKCHAEVEKGSLYCPKCLQEIHWVTMYKGRHTNVFLNVIVDYSICIML